MAVQTLVEIWSTLAEAVFGCAPTTNEHLVWHIRHPFRNLGHLKRSTAKATPKSHTPDHRTPQPTAHFRPRGAQRAQPLANHVHTVHRKRPPLTLCLFDIDADASAAIDGFADGALEPHAAERMLHK